MTDLYAVGRGRHGASRGPTVRVLAYVVFGLVSLTRLIDYLLISYTPPVCIEEAHIDGNPLDNVDLSDFTRLIDYLFISFAPLPSCLYVYEEHPRAARTLEQMGNEL